MTPNQALDLLAQIAQDFVNTLPPSAKIALGNAAQQALNVLKPVPPAAPAEPGQAS